MGLLDRDLKIIGASRTQHSRQSWLDSLGREYPGEFSQKMDYISCDLSDPDSLKQIPIGEESTYFLSVPPERFGDAIANLTQAGHLDDPETSRLVIEKPFSTIMNLLIIYSIWLGDIYARNKYIALIIISVKILLIISLPLGFLMYFLNHYGTGLT